MKVTLKLTNSEINILNSCAEKGLISRDIISTNGKHPILSYTPTYIHDIDKFREFLNDEIEDIEFGKRVVTRSVAERLYSLKSILSKLDKAVVQNNKPKDETLKKLTDIVNWVEDKYDGDELREHMIVKTIKEDLLS